MDNDDSNLYNTSTWEPLRRLEEETTWNTVSRKPQFNMAHFSSQSFEEAI